MIDTFDTPAAFGHDHILRTTDIFIMLGELTHTSMNTSPVI